MPPLHLDPAAAAELTSRLVPRLRAAGCVFAEDEAALLVSAADDLDHLEAMTLDRVAGRPLEQVVGWADFAGVRVLLDPGVFVPRQRTRLMVDVATPRLRSGAPGAIVVDLGCGSGALGAAVLARVPGVEVWAADLDPAAVACARRNLGDLPSGRVLRGDLYAALPDSLRGRVSVLLANAPYVPTDAIATMPAEARDHEHRLALDGGGDGLDVQRRVLAGAPDWLAPGGLVLVETGAPQLPLTLALVAAAGLTARTWEEPDHGTLVVGGERTRPRQ